MAELLVPANDMLEIGEKMRKKIQQDADKYQDQDGMPGKYTLFNGRLVRGLYLVTTYLAIGEGTLTRRRPSISPDKQTTILNSLCRYELYTSLSRIL